MTEPTKSHRPAHACTCTEATTLINDLTWGVAARYMFPLFCLAHCTCTCTEATNLKRLRHSTNEMANLGSGSEKRREGTYLKATLTAEK